MMRDDNDLGRDELGRRAFLGRVGGGCAFAALALSGCETAEIYKGSAGLTTDAPFDVNGLPELAAAGSMATLEGDGDTVVLVRENDDTVLAFHSICPHLGCSLTSLSSGGFGSWEAADQQLKCNCHGSRFNTDGTLDPKSKPQPWGNGPQRVKTYTVEFDKGSGKGTVKAG